MQQINAKNTNEFTYLKGYSMKIIKILLKAILFVPAIIGTFMIVVLYAPRIPFLLLMTLLLLWVGSGLLALSKPIGGLVGIMSPILLLIIMQGEHMHVNPMPYAVMYMVFYAVCGFLVFKGKFYK
ncbi:MAG: hypothetical protein R3Y09_10020 [Clostridia bacterium]